MCLGFLVLWAGLPAGASAADPLLAPAKVCPDQNSASISAARQEAAMSCLVRFARRGAGRAPGRAVAKLNRSAQMKSDLIARCGRFTHAACGKPWNSCIRKVGFRGLAFENLAAGSGSYATPRAAMVMWLGSPGHRASLLDGRVTVFGVGSRQRVMIDGWRGSVWALHLGRPKK
jgi:uncharacterized protein YkwD